MTELDVFESGRYRVDVEGCSVVVAVALEISPPGAWVHSSESPKFPEAMWLTLKKKDPCDCGKPCYCLRAPWTVVFQGA